MSLIREQSKLISTLQKTIENLNLKLKMLQNSRDVIGVVSEDVVKNVEKYVLQDVSDKGKSENVHSKLVHEDLLHLKCAKKTNEEKNYKYFLSCRDSNYRPLSPEAQDLPVRQGTLTTVNSLLSLLSNFFHLMLL